MKEWPLIKLSDLILSLESGSRPKGGVDKYEAGLPSIGAEHLGTNGDFNFLNIKYPTITITKTEKTAYNTEFIVGNSPYMAT